MACKLLDVLNVVLHREDLARGQGHQLVAHPDFKLRTLPLCHPPVCKAAECTGSVATHIVFVFHHGRSASQLLATRTISSEWIRCPQMFQALYFDPNQVDCTTALNGLFLNQGDIPPWAPAGVAQQSPVVVSFLPLIRRLTFLMEWLAVFQLNCLFERIMTHEKCKTADKSKCFNL